MGQRERRPHVSTETVNAWEQQVWDTSPPWVPPYNMEKQLLDETGRVFNPIFHDDKDALNSVAWTWPTACAWVAWQTFDGAASGVAAFRHWRGMIWREKEWSFDVRPGRLMPVPEADRLLVNALTTGKLSAKAVRGGDVVTIGAGEWPRLAWEKAAHGEVLEFDRLLMLGAPRYEGVTLPRAAVMRLWPALDGWAPDGAEGAMEEPPAAAEAPLDVDFVPVAEEPQAPEVPALAGPVVEEIGAEPSAEHTQGTEARAARSNHAQRRVAYLREKVPDLSKPGASAALRRHSDEYQKLHGKEPVERSQHAKDVKALRTPQK